MSERHIEYVRLDAVLPALRNPKAHASPDIAASISRFGFTEPVVLDERTGRLIAGHGRLESLAAAQAAGDEPPDGIEVAEDGTWALPVVRGWASRSDADAEAALVASNRISEAGGWDDSRLAELLGDYSADPDWLLGTGYTTADFDLLLSSLAEPGGPTDPNAEWTGMPEFEQNDMGSKYATTVHFITHEDAERFWLEIFGEDKPHKTAWWPKHDGFEGSDQSLAYVAVEEGEEPDGADAAVPDLHSV